MSPGSQVVKSAQVCQSYAASQEHLWIGSVTYIAILRFVSMKAELFCLPFSPLVDITETPGMMSHRE